MTSENTDRIRELNDTFRTTGRGGRIVMSAAVSALSAKVQAIINEKVRTFSSFTKDNDPYGEHDFGAFKLCGEEFFWKIEYYDAKCEHGSEDPSDPKQTTRVLTIMYASDY